MLILAVTLHNIPDGMAVGVVYAGLASENTSITVSAALALSLGIAIQNFPEGAIISMPLRSEGMGKPKAFFYGILSGAVEPVGCLLYTSVLAALTFPSIFWSTGSVASAVIGTAVAMLLAYFEKSLVVVAVAAIVVVYCSEMLIG